MDLYYVSLAGQLTEKMCAMRGEPTDEMVIERARALAAALGRAERVRRMRRVLALVLTGMPGPATRTSRDSPAR